MTHAAAPDTATPPPADPAPPTPVEEESGRGLELFAAILLGIAAIFTAISAYKAALLDGDALQGYTQSTRSLNDSGTFYSQGNQTFTQDQALFVQYATASQAENAELTTYLRTLMRPTLVKAVDWWESTDGAKTPFEEKDENPYAVEDFAEAEKLEKTADSQFKEGAVADDQGDKFELSSVLLAITLFLGGISTLFKSRRTQRLMLVVSTVSLGIGGAALGIAFGG